MPTQSLPLPRPEAPANDSLIEALAARRSVRRYTPGGVCLAEVSLLLYSAQGATHPKGFRCVPSAGALFPLELFLISGECPELDPGVYRYIPQEHALQATAQGDKRGDVAAACLNQAWMAQAQIMIGVCAVYSRITDRYGQRGEQYVHMEVGAAGQDIGLAAAAMGLGTVMVGAFNDVSVQQVLGARGEEHPLLIMPVGRME